MADLRKVRNEHSRGANCWTVLWGMVTVQEGLTEAEADALIESRRQTIVPLGRNGGSEEPES